MGTRCRVRIWRTVEYREYRDIEIEDYKGRVGDREAWLQWKAGARLVGYRLIGSDDYMNGEGFKPDDEGPFVQEAEDCDIEILWGEDK